MSIVLRDLKTDQDIALCIALQKEIWGLDDAGAMSPITLKALAMSSPKMGMLDGAFDGEKLVGIAIALPSFEPGVAYGHMLGVLSEYRDENLGQKLAERNLNQIRDRGYHRVVWTFEPLESRNAHVYINKACGRGIHYYENYYTVEDDLNQGLPIDRLLYEMDLTGKSDKISPLLTLVQALERYPVATPGHLPEADAVLIEIPASLQELKNRDFNRALDFRMATRAIFSEYLNRRGFVVERLLTDAIADSRRSYYLAQSPRK